MGEATQGPTCYLPNLQHRGESGQEGSSLPSVPRVQHEAPTGTEAPVPTGVLLTAFCLLHTCLSKAAVSGLWVLTPPGLAHQISCILDACVRIQSSSKVSKENNFMVGVSQHSMRRCSKELQQ